MLKPSCIALAALVTSWSAAALGQTPTSYTASWTSVDQHPAAPEWFKDAKFGIYFHWGAFGAAQYGSEWYPRRMYDRNDLYSYHNQTYGDPLSAWPFDKFITGANDKSGRFVQFAPKLVSAGGKWDPDAWAQLFVDAGARFAGPVMEHHDGFSMWDSKVNEWNSLSKGPMLNLAKLHTDAFRKRGLRILAAMHHAFNFTGYYQFAPTPSDASLQKLYGKLSATAENQLWYDKLKEVVDEFQPDIIWQDFNLNQVDEARRLQFLAYYYNAALSWKKEVVATYKDGFNNRGEVFDYERGGPGDITNPYWLTDDTVSSTSWCYVSGMPYYTDAQIVHSFIDRVSKNGNLLLNISPMPDGSIPQRQKDILIAIGTFLKQNGTAIYNTRAWTVYGEGPTKMGGGAFTAPTAGTASDYRYTASKDGDAIYAIILGWPGNGRQINLTAVTPTRFNVGTGKVFLFAPLGGGSAASLAFSQDGSGLHVTLPSAQPYTAIAYAMKISKSGAEPAPTPTIDGSNPDGGAPDGGGMDASQTGTGGAGGSGGRGGSGGAGGTSGTSGAAGAAAGAGGTAGTGGATSGVAGSGAGGFGGTVAAGSAGSAGGTGGTTGAGGVSAGRGGGAAAAATGTGGTGGAGLDNGSAGCTCALATRGATPIGGDVILVFVALAMIASRRQRSVDIARGLVAGEAWAVSATWRRFAPMVRFNAERSLGSRSEADDVVQEVFFRVFRRAKTLRDPSCLRGFILAFTTRVLKRELRRRRGRGRFPLLQGEGAADPPSRASDFESRDLLTRLFALLDRLKPRDRVIFVFRRMESLSLDEIAATMDLSISTVKRSVAHASGRLASWVEADPGLAGLGFRGRTRPDRAMLSRSAPSPRRPRSR